MAYKIIIDSDIPFIRGVFDRYADVLYCNGSEITAGHVQNADALIIRTRTICNAELLEGSSVKYIASATIGYDHIDTDYCTQNGIQWSTAPGCNSESVTQYLASALLVYARDHNIDLSKRVLGVIGVGNIGKKVIRLAEILDMHVVLNDPPRVRNEGVCGFISLEGLLREADIITLHVPLTNTGVDATIHMVDDKFLKRLNPGSILINTSRGEVINTASLDKQKVKGNPTGIILDVWENEPNINSRLLKISSIATPHIAGYSADGKANGTRIVVRAISHFFDLGLDDWEPENVPLPGNTILTCNGLGKSFQEIVTELVLSTYNVMDDMKRLINEPDNFEALRSNYPLRREYSAYTVVPMNISEANLRKIKRLGFQISSL